MDFSFEYEFRAPSLEAYWRCYFDPAHVARLDSALGLKGRELLEKREDDETMFRRVHVTPGRELPGWLQKMTRAGLSYEQRETFYKAEHRIDVEIVPEMFPKRTTIGGVYSLELVGENTVVRKFVGAVSVRVPVVGKKIERTIVDDMEKSYAAAIPLTQSCLDGHGDCAESV